MSYVTCSKCNEENPGGALHCGRCGASLAGLPKVERGDAVPLEMEKKPEVAHPCDRCGAEADGGAEFSYMCGDKLGTSRTPVGGNQIRVTTTYGSIEPVTVQLCPNCYKAEARSTWLRTLLGSLAGVMFFGFILLAAAYAASQGVRDLTTTVLIFVCFGAVGVLAALTVLIATDMTPFVQRTGADGGSLARGLLTGSLNTNLLKYARLKASYRGHSSVWTMGQYSMLKRTHPNM